MLVADYFCTKTFPSQTDFESNNWKLSSNRHWTRWYCNTFKFMYNFLHVLSNHFCASHSCKKYLCGFEHRNTLHTRMLCMFYFITDCYQNLMYYWFASIPRRDHEKSHLLKQLLLTSQPSLRTAVSQAWPSGRIQGLYGRQSVVAGLIQLNI